MQNLTFTSHLKKNISASLLLQKIVFGFENRDHSRIVFNSRDVKFFKVARSLVLFKNWKIYKISNFSQPELQFVPQKCVMLLKKQF
jgi:hypothetical protein